MKLEDCKLGVRVCWYEKERLTGTVDRVCSDGLVFVSFDSCDSLWLHPKALRRLVKKRKRLDLGPLFEAFDGLDRANKYGPDFLGGVRNEIEKLRKQWEDKP